MFGRLYEVIDNVKALDEKEIFRKSISEQEVKELILRLNRLEQLFKEGIDADGDELQSKKRSSYSYYTEKINIGNTYTFMGVSKQKIAGENYFLYDTGFFFRSFNVRVYDDGFTITANDETEDGVELVEKFGAKILGLTTESIDELIKKILPQFRTETRKRILG